MPCDCSHMEPFAHERESKLACVLYRWLARRLGREYPAWVSKGAEEFYGCSERVHEITAMLCALCKEAPEAVIYDGREPTARKLADWWDEHQEADRVKARKEAAARKAAALAESGLAKLTPDEKAALNL